jgi:hypothetical protein
MEHDNPELYQQFLSASQAITGSKKGVDECLYKHTNDEGNFVNFVTAKTQVNLNIAPSLETIMTNWEKPDIASDGRPKSKSIAWLEEGLQIQEQQYVPR